MKNIFLSFALFMVCLFIVHIWVVNSHIYKMAIDVGEEFQYTQARVNQTVDAVHSAAKTIERTAKKIEARSDEIGLSLKKAEREALRELKHMKEDIQAIDKTLRF